MKIWKIDFRDMVFLDCLANISGPALAASLFGFHEVPSIELFNEGAEFSVQLADKFVAKNAQCNIRVGRLQVVFTFVY